MATLPDDLAISTAEDDKETDDDGEGDVEDDTGKDDEADDDVPQPNAKLQAL